jgi:hypothetical protein
MKTHQVLTIEAALRTAVAGVARTHGVDLKLEAREKGAGRTIFAITLTDADEAKRLFDAYAPRFGYPPDWYGRTFHHSGHAYTIMGVRPTAETNCFCITCAPAGITSSPDGWYAWRPDC